MPDGVREHFQQGMGKRGKDLRQAWFALFDRYKEEYPELADQLERMQQRHLPEGWDKGLPVFPADPKGKATRDTIGQGPQLRGEERTLADRRRGRPGPVDQDPLDVRRRRRLRGRQYAAATSTSASASTPWAPSSTAWR